jgi:hypothetical protein
MTLSGKTERQTSDDVVLQGDNWILKGLLGWALLLSTFCVLEPFAHASGTFTYVIKLAASTVLLIAGAGLLAARKD